MAELPGQRPAAAGRGGLRASSADREQVVGVLKAAFVQGLLEQDEFGLRVSQALTSRTYAELAVITADLPAGLSDDQPPRPAPSPARAARAPGERGVLRPRRMVAAATVLYVAMWPLALLLPVNGEGDPMDGMNMVGISTLVYILVLISIGIWAQRATTEGPSPAG